MEYLQKRFDSFTKPNKQKGWLRVHTNFKEINGKSFYGDYDPPNRDNPDAIGELAHSNEIMTQRGYAGAFFDRGLEGIEGFLFKDGEPPLPVSLKEFSGNFNTIMEDIEKTAQDIRNNIDKYNDLVKLGDEANTLFDIRISSISKEDFKNLLENDSRFQSLKDTFGEIVFTFEDGSTLKYNSNLEEIP